MFPITAVFVGPRIARAAGVGLGILAAFPPVATSARPVQAPTVSPFISLQNLARQQPANEDAIDDLIVALAKVDERSRGEILGLGNNVTPRLKAQAHALDNRSALFSIVRDAEINGSSVCVRADIKHCETGFLSILSTSASLIGGSYFQLCPDRIACDTANLIYHPPVKLSEAIPTGIRVAVIFELVNKGTQSQILSTWRDGGETHTAIKARVRRVIIFSRTGKVISDDREPQ